MITQVRMPCALRFAFVCLALASAAAASVRAAPPPTTHPLAPQALADAAVKAAGGSDKLLKLFRIKEDLYLGAATKPLVRTSVLEPPAHWWMNGRDRVVDDKEPAIELVWAWTLAILVDPKSKLAAAPATTIDDRAAVGLVVSESLKTPLTIYFDTETFRLVRIDHRGHQHKLTGYRQVDGTWYPGKCSGINPQGKEWYHTEIKEIERLSELPADLKR